MTDNTAGLGARALAFIIDWHIRIIGCSLLLWLLVSLDSSVSDLMADPSTRSNISPWEFSHIFAPLVIYFLYHPLLEILMHGSTPGKKWVGICVTTEDGAAPSVAQHLIRNLMRTIDCIPLTYGVAAFMTLYGEKQLRLGDSFSKTKVIYQHSALDLG